MTDNCRLGTAGQLTICPFIVTLYVNKSCTHIWLFVSSSHGFLQGNSPRQFSPRICGVHCKSYSESAAVDARGRNPLVNNNFELAYWHGEEDSTKSSLTVQCRMSENV